MSKSIIFDAGDRLMPGIGLPTNIVQHLTAYTLFDIQVSFWRFPQNQLTDAKCIDVIQRTQNEWVQKTIQWNFKEAITRNLKKIAFD